MNCREHPGLGQSSECNIKNCTTSIWDQLTSCCAATKRFTSLSLASSARCSTAQCRRLRAVLCDGNGNINTQLGLGCWVTQVRGGWIPHLLLHSLPFLLDLLLQGLTELLHLLVVLSHTPGGGEVGGSNCAI